jgi:outer membrane murein-binding lipoprotein Lpp
MRNAGLGALALVVSLAAFGLSAVAAVKAFRKPPLTGTKGTVAASDVEELSQQVAVLRRQMEALRTGLAARSAAPAGPGGQPPTTEPLAASLAGLAQRLGELEQRAQSLGGAGLVPVPLSPEQLARATSIAVDASARVADRVAALRALRPLGGRTDGRTPEVTRAMAELIAAADTPARLRADIIRQLEWVDHPHLKTPLTTVLANDPDPETRAEAVETLQSFYGDPEVQALVNRIKESDPDPRVRREAERRLADWKAGRRGG